MRGNCAFDFLCSFPVTTHKLKSSVKCILFFAGTRHSARQEFISLAGPTPVVPDFAFGTWFTWWHQVIYDNHILHGSSIFILQICSTPKLRPKEKLSDGQQTSYPSMSGLSTWFYFIFNLSLSFTLIFQGIATIFAPLLVSNKFPFYGLELARGWCWAYFTLSAMDGSFLHVKKQSLKRSLVL